METVKKGDFVEISFTGASNNEVFDTTDSDKAKEIGLNTDVKPFVICIGYDMVLKGLDETLPGKEIGKKFDIHLNPEKAFGKRNPQLIKLIPLRVFREKNVNPTPGMSIQLDNNVVKVISVSGGRVMVDFNNPLAGKDIDYEITITKVITDDKEKIDSLQDYFFRHRFDYTVDGKKVVFKEEQIKPFLQMFGEKFKEMTGYEFTVEEKSKDKPATEKEKSKEKLDTEKKEEKKKTGAKNEKGPEKDKP